METIVACKICGLAQHVSERRPGTVAECGRCGSTLSMRHAGSLERTAAFSLAALIFYLPANLYPILRMDWYGATSESTVWDGCAKLFSAGQWPVAAVVFLASILIPLLKLGGLLWLVAAAKFKLPSRRRERTWVFRAIEIMGPWAMLDVFLVAILVALVKFGQLATLLPGPGLLAFAALVVFTVLASASFDPGSIWEDAEVKP